MHSSESENSDNEEIESYECNSKSIEEDFNIKRNNSV